MTDEISKRLYLSGPIKGLAIEEAKQRFIDAALRLTRRGYDCVNPFECEPVCLPGCASEDAHCFMRADIAAMMTCHGVALLDGWESSRGARLEQSIAVMTGMEAQPLDAWPILRSVVLATSRRDFSVGVGGHTT